MNQRFKLLEVLASATEPISMARLAVRAWKKFPVDFGMRNYPYPNNVAVLSRVQGADGLVRNGLAKESIGPKSRTLVQITSEGRDLLKKTQEMEAMESAGWECRVLYFPEMNADTAGTLENALNDLGSKGWELVAVPTCGWGWAILKRPKSEKKK